MDVDQQPVPVFGRDHIRRHDERPHAVDHGLLDLDMQPFHHPGNVLDGPGGAGIGDRLPFIAGLGQHVPVGAQRQADDFCHLRADGGGHRHRARRNLQLRRVGGLGLRGGNSHRSAQAGGAPFRDTQNRVAARSVFSSRFPCSVFLLMIQKSAAAVMRSATHAQPSPTANIPPTDIFLGKACAVHTMTGFVLMVARFACPPYNRHHPYSGLMPALSITLRQRSSSP